MPSARLSEVSGAGSGFSFESGHITVDDLNAMTAGVGGAMVVAWLMVPQILIWTE